MGLKIVVGLGNDGYRRRYLDRQGQKEGYGRSGQDTFHGRFSPLSVMASGPKSKETRLSRSRARASTAASIECLYPIQDGILRMFAHGQRRAQRERSPSAGNGAPVSSETSANMLTSEGASGCPEPRRSKAVGLTRPVIGILTDYDHLGVVERRGIEGGENLGARG